MVLCTAYFTFVSEKGIRGLKDLFDLGILFYTYDTTSAKTEVLSRVECSNEIRVKKEKILYGVGNWRLYTKAEARAIISAVSKKLIEKYSDEDNPDKDLVKDEKYEVKIVTATE